MCFRVVLKEKNINRQPPPQEKKDKGGQGKTGGVNVSSRPARHGDGAAREG